MNKGNTSKSPPNKGDKRTNNNQKSASPRKKYKVSSLAVAQPNKKAWQIKGESLRGGLLCFYLQKSIATGQNQQPFIRNLIQRLQKEQELRLAEMGIIFFASRRGPDGEALLSNPDQDDAWTLFLSRGEDVGSLQDWLDVVESRLNEDDLSENKNVFKWPVCFSVTSWGQHKQVRCLQDVIIDTDVGRIVTGLQDLTKPKNRINLTKLPIEDYFHSKDEGMDIIKDYLDIILED
jgi:hypothetical protein